MNICVISYCYPSRHNENEWVFVKQLVEEFAKKGNNCYVLSPYNINHFRRYNPVRDFYCVGDGSVYLFRPWYLSFSNLQIMGFNITKWFHDLALKRAYRMMKIIPDIIYCHFWSSGYDGYQLAKKDNISLFVATGESNISQMFKMPSDLDRFRTAVKGVVCVSSKNQDESVLLGLTTIDKCKVFPNAVNNDLFYKRNRLECRRLLGLPQDVFIVAFVGWFNERKGSLRVADAIRRLSDRQVFSLFIGKTMSAMDMSFEPECDRILFKGSLPHDKIPVYLGAADCFVLPTLREGCCNAVVEALACGLPVISSDLPFNWDVLNKTNSILVDPNNIEEISEAIGLLYDYPEKRAMLAHGALKTAEGNTISSRAESILNFIKEKINSL